MVQENHEKTELEAFAQVVRLKETLQTFDNSLQYKPMSRERPDGEWELFVLANKQVVARLAADGKPQWDTKPESMNDVDDATLQAKYTEVAALARGRFRN